MEAQNERQTNTIKNGPPMSAYWGLAGVFVIVWAVIYIALLLRVHFLTVRNGIAVMSETAANLTFAIALLTMLGALYLYIVFSRKELLYNLKEPGAMMFIFALVVFSNIYIAYVNPYAMFVSLTALIALPFSKKRDAFVLNVFAALISAFAMINMAYNLEFGFTVITFTAITGVIGGAVATYSVSSDMTRLKAILRAFITLAAVTAIYAVFLCSFSMSVQPLINNISAIGISAAAQMLASTVVVPLVETMFNITTDFKLIELTNHRAPLIHRLINETPGTFNHSLAVANFAEICANAIGEDPYLARACAYYHDVGKLNNAMYFTENQAGYNPHDEILPEVSAEIIRQHTTDGYELCKQYRVPEEVARITIEHHGTLPITYFYNKAKTLTDSEVDMDEYRYHGDTPRDKIAAIIMICDSAEAAIRAMDSPDGERVDKLLKNMIDERLRLGQFDECAITMKDLNTVRSAIVGAYGGLFHKRIKYNNGSGRDGAHV